MPNYNIYLGDPFGHDMRWSDLCGAVRALFLGVMEGLDDYDGVAVQHAPAEVAPGPKELLCYVVPSPLDALVGPHFANRFGGPSVGGTTGWNNDEALTGSEVYANMTRGIDRLADLIFHEFLHNKLRMTDAQLHNHPSGGLARSPIAPPVTPGNAALMRGALAQNRPQWVGGWDLEADPMRGINDL